MLSAAGVLAFGYDRAAAAIRDALRGGLNPADDPPRAAIAVGSGATLLTMPSYDEAGVGVKVVTHNPANPPTGHPLVHGIYVHFDRDTLAPRAVLDGAALTLLRTPAVSVVAVEPALARIPAATDVVVFGAGPQGRGHAHALHQIATTRGLRGPARVTYVLRQNLDRALDTLPGVEVDVVPAGSTAMTEALRRADIVVCATGSAEPLFDSKLLVDDVVVIAIGGHDPGATEIDTHFAGRAHVVVEDCDTARRECGEIVQSVRAGTLRADDLISISDVANGRADSLLQSGPMLFKGSGMAWQDLVVASAILRDRG